MSHRENEKITIAYMTADWNRELVAVALDAVNKYIGAHKHIRVQVFNCFGFALHSRDARFKYRIYELPDLSAFDGVIVQAHQIMDAYALESIEERILKAGIPAISVGGKMKGCMYIGTDDYEASRCMAEHVIGTHGAKTFLYLKGAERGSYGEAYNRRMGFIDACREHGINEQNISYIDGEWQSIKGKEAVEELLAAGADLPDAIVSANDEMALGALGALSDAGVHVPEDVIVCGFDGIYSAGLSEPRLSTVRRDFRRMLTTAMNLLVRKINGREAEEEVYSPYAPSFSDSCGCAQHSPAELLRLKQDFYFHMRQLEAYYYLQDKLTAALFAAVSPMEILDAMEEYYEIFGSPHMNIFFNQFYYDAISGDGKLAAPDTLSFSDALVLAARGGYAASAEKKHAYLTCARAELTDLGQLTEEAFTIFYPLHMNGVMLGFMVLDDAPTVTEMNLHESIVNMFVFAMENSRQRMITGKLNEKLDALSVTDPLTGLYNRFGFERYGTDLYKEICRRGSCVRVLFIDIDDLKVINDRFGHENGDQAIRAVAQVIRESCRKDDFKMRYGGDEFVIITGECKADICGRIAAHIASQNASNELPFALSISVGDYVSDEDGGESLEEIMARADERMYAQKKQKKEGTAPGYCKKIEGKMKEN